MILNDLLASLCVIGDARQWTTVALTLNIFVYEITDWTPKTDMLTL